MEGAPWDEEGAVVEAAAGVEAAPELMGAGSPAGLVSSGGVQETNRLAKSRPRQRIAVNRFI